MRSVKPWEGKTDDAMPPKGVRDRIFEAHGHICHWCKSLIIPPKMKWALDHVKSIESGGENVESNLAPIHTSPIKCHATKSAGEATIRAKAKRQRQAHHGIKDEPARKIESRGFVGKQAKPKGEKLKQIEALPRPSLFRKI